MLLTDHTPSGELSPTTPRSGHVPGTTAPFPTPTCAYKETPSTKSHVTTLTLTVLIHDSENRTKVKGYDRRVSYVRDISYCGVGLTHIAQLTRLTDVSAHCEQFIKYECFYAILLYNGYGWWTSHTRKKMTYWGGGNSVPNMCACGSNGTCADCSYRCNCDINDFVWLEDSGLLTNNSHLPMIQLRFGDTGDAGEEGYHTLGKLKCYGME